MSNIHDNLKKILEEISLAAEKADRAKDSVKLIAVSKTFPAADIQDAYNFGQRLFGENRVAELEGKTPVLPEDIQWHLIGHLQSNKSMKAVENASWIHSVESEKLIRHIEKAASGFDKKVNILLEVNVSGEESKFGLHSFEDVLSVADFLPGFSLKEENGPLLQNDFDDDGVINENDRLILDHLRKEGDSQFDSISAATGISAGELSRKLIALEISHRIERCPNGAYRRLR